MIKAATGTVSLKTFRQKQAELCKKCFIKRETEGATEQSLAGALALKRALVKLLAGKTGKSTTISEKTFVVLHKPSGKPYVKLEYEGVPELSGYAKVPLHVSITHSRISARAIAAIEVDENE